MRRLLVPAVIAAVIVLVAVGLMVISAVGDNQEDVDTAIQSRVESVVLTCEETNERHDDVTETLARLRRESLRKAETAAEREAIRENQGPTLLFIDALVPKRDCEARARELVPEAFP